MIPNTMSLWNDLGKKFREVANISEYIDIEGANNSIRKNIYFRGANVWILAFSIIIASVGLNINSTAVIIGAMLISPLMGPIIGIGLGLGIDDTGLLKVAAKNLLVMVIVSLTASFLYFLISPLNPVTATEIESRTNPTIYDVIIALFGGFAGIFEQSRKEKGTVLSGVAIATALMPPLCTAGFGLAHLKFGYFLGAMYLFFINCIFIVLATYITVKYLHFPEIKFQNAQAAKKTKSIIAIITILVIVPSLWSAFLMIRRNNFEREVIEFVAKNKTLDNGYIYDYKINTSGKRKAEIYITGEIMKSSEKQRLINAAQDFGIKENELAIKEHSINSEDAGYSEKLVKGIYERTDSEINKREAQIRLLEDKLKKISNKEIPYARIAKEIATQYPEITDLYLTKGAEVKNTDSLAINERILVVAKSKAPLSEEKTKRLSEWLKIRLEDSTVVVINQR
ncbi:MAG: DUF389 domain-containing protein [Bacteroidales bacterium]|nr:DUF389 domain-containing protein [Bacteroidales bacterium]